MTKSANTEDRLYAAKIVGNAGIREFFTLLGLLSVAIGLFNLFPIPLLDGGEEGVEVDVHYEAGHGAVIPRPLPFQKSDLEHL